MRTPSLVPFLIALATLTACNMLEDYVPSIYRIDIDQGNIITQEMIDQLEPGMNQRQVRFVMGTPLIVDVFHQHRWDYLYSEKPGGGLRTQQKVSLYFEDGGLARMQGDFKPDNKPGFAPTKDTTVIVPKIQQEKTIGQKIKSFFGFSDE